MLAQSLRLGSELSPDEKAQIIAEMSGIKDTSERAILRRSLADRFGISESSIPALIANHTRRPGQEGVQQILPTGKINGNRTVGEILIVEPTLEVQTLTQDRVYAITSLVGITEKIREDILEEFSDIIRNNASNSRYDFYQDIEAISIYYSIDPDILEQFIRNYYKWLGTRLDELKNGRVNGSPQEPPQIIEPPQLSGEGAGEPHEPIARLLDPGLGGDPMLEETVDGVDTGLIAVVADAGVSESSIKVMDEGIALSEEDRVFIQEFAGSFDLNNNEQRALFLQDIFDLFPEATLDDVKRVLPDFPDDAVHANTKRSGEGMGALMNYNNEVKNKWRQRLKEFIDENADPAKRATMKVLCLPGVECLEIPLYLELGFRPENIVGVEAGIVQGRKDQALIARFQANAAGYGIQTRIGKIEKVLETEETVFDVVSLDFLGPISPVTKEIIGVIKYSKRVILLTNFLGKREGEEMKESLRASGLISTANLGIISDLWDCPLSDYRLKRDSLQLAEAREAGTLASIVLEYSLIGYKGPFDEKLKGIFKNLREFTIRETGEDIGYEKLRTLVIFEITSMIGRYQQKFSEHLASLGENGRGFFDGLNAYLIKFILNLLLGMRPGPSKSFKYKSKSTGGGTSPMFCDFQVFERLSQSDFEQDKKLGRAVFSLLETVVSKLTLNIVPRVLPCTNSKRTFPVLDGFNGYVMTEGTNIVVQIDFSDVHEYILRNKDKLLEAENHEREEII